MSKKVARPAPAEGKEGGPTAAALPGHRERILKTAMTLLAEGGRDALTTRAVAEAARVQPPVLYRLFSDKAGLLNAVAEYGFNLYMAKKRPAASAKDPVEALRAGWRLHVRFGLTHPELYLLMYADPRSGKQSLAAQRAHRMLLEHMRCVAAAGRLRVTEERAAHLFHAAACGVIMTLLGMASDQRDLSLPDTACDAALATIITDQTILPAPAVASAAVTLHALVTGFGEARPLEMDVFTEAERTLLTEWLDRLIEARFVHEQSMV